MTPGAFTHAPFQQVRLTEDFQRITHHETDYSGTEGRRKKKIKERVKGGGENVSLARVL